MVRHYKIERYYKLYIIFLLPLKTISWHKIASFISKYINATEINHFNVQDARLNVFNLIDSS